MNRRVVVNLLLVLGYSFVMGIGVGMVLDTFWLGRAVACWTAWGTQGATSDARAAVGVGYGATGPMATVFRASLAPFGATAPAGGTGTA